jgi:2-methylcitrate dehydratase PrpD
MREVPDITETLCSFVADLSRPGIPPDVTARARMLVLDCVGNIIRARHASESTPALVAAVKAGGLNRGDAHVFGDPALYGPAGAVLLNAGLAHSLDFDDTHAAAIVHAAAPIVPAAFGAAELIGASGADVLVGIVAGYEVALRIALALPPGAHYERGFHPSATCGVFGAVAAASRVLGLDAKTTASGFGIALSQTAGSLQFLANGAWTKRFQVGWASMAGFVAALLAREGFRGAAKPIEGKHGFLRAYAPQPVPELAIRDLGTTWELMHTGLKPYPSCRWGHAGIDAALALRKEHGLRNADIDCATLGISRAGMLLIGGPAEKKANPTNLVEAQFSGPFVIATALVTGEVGWDSYQGLNDPQVRRLMQRIVCENDPEIEAHYPINMAGKLTIQAGGQIYTRTVIVPKGEPDNFLTETELRAKFCGLVEPVLRADRTARLIDQLLQLDHLPSVTALLELSCDTGLR